MDEKIYKRLKKISVLNRISQKLRLRNLALHILQWRGKVLDGPFRGLQITIHRKWVWIPTSSEHLVWMPMIQGTFEKELHQTLENILCSESPIQTVFEIGAHMGYYAVGLALRLPHAQVIAWEASKEIQGCLYNTIHANGVGDRVHVHGTCTPESLSDAADKKPPDLVICDIDGPEGELFTRDIIRKMAQTIFIVETHGTSVVEKLEANFSQTHAIQKILPVLRNLKDWNLPSIIVCSDAMKQVAMSEWRTNKTPWIIAVPKT